MWHSLDNAALYFECDALHIVISGCTNINMPIGTTWAYGHMENQKVFGEIVGNYFPKANFAHRYTIGIISTSGTYNYGESQGHQLKF